MVLQDKEGSIWESHQKKSLTMRPYRYVEIGVKYWENYSPVVHCMSIRSMLTLSILRELHTKSVYFFMSYTQDDIK